MESKVSIIIPIYNSILYLKRCIDSIINQSYSNLEIILVDDGSTDGSELICDKYQEIDSRIKVFHKKNGGVSSARNYGISVASGKFICFIDSDDWIDYNYIEILLKNIISKDCDLVCCSYRMIKKNGKLNYRYDDQFIQNDELMLSIFDFFINISNAPWGKIYKKEIIDKNKLKFDSSVPYAEDSIFNIQYYSKIKSVSVISDIIYNYNFINDNQAMKKFYKDIYVYIFKVYSLKKEIIIAGNNEELLSLLKNEEIRLLDSIIEHYILFNNPEIISDLKKCYNLFGYDYDYDTIKNIIFKWKKNNFLKYFKYRLKKMLKGEKL